MAFGNSVWRQLSGGEGADEFTSRSMAKGWRRPQYDLLIRILSAVMKLTSRWRRPRWPPLATYRRERRDPGFRWVEERDLSGFVDGTENPAREKPAAKWRSLKTAWMRAAATRCSSSAGT
ncbi:Dyp-type peroxidase [Klebsiella pneumoniae]|nr:Dyp-type peroxidase [Klebsiella pneumoniae]